MKDNKAKKSGLEFEVPEGWKVERLDSLAEIQQGVSKGKKFKGIETVFHPYLRVANVKDGYFDLSEIKDIEIPLSDLDRYAILEKDILITEGGDPDKLGRGSIWMGEVQRPVFQNHLFRIRSKKSKLEPWFLFNYLQSHKAKTYFLNSAKQTTGIASINSSQVKETPILLPPLPEQRAIAQVLGKMDEAIQTTERLIAQKDLRKKWLVQNLLKGKKRLKGFEGEWKKLGAGEIFKSVSKKGFSDVELLSATQDRGMIPRTMLEGRVTMPTTGTEGFKLVEIGDFVISLRSFQGGLEYSNYKGLVSPAYTVLQPKKTINELFYKQYFKSMEFIGRLATAVIGIRDGKQISYDDFCIVKIPYPSIEEQTAISRVLQTADQEINFLKAKADKLREQKKGMMQVLLTGKVRLKLN